jgi:predicted xylose isomerase-like sugar epimerase
MKALSFAKAKKRKDVTDLFHVSLIGDADRVTCKMCDVSEVLVAETAEGKDRNQQVDTFVRKHYGFHPIMVEVEVEK